MLLLALAYLVLPSVSSRYIGELLCRKCGAHITNQEELMNITGSDVKPKYSYVFPLVGKNTTINVFDNPAGESFHVAGCKKAHLKYFGQPSSEATWIPGMQWTICICSQCGQHLGWHFQPQDTSMSKEEDNFIGVVLDYLISADYVDTMTKMPV